MNTQVIEKTWVELKGKIQSKWSKLSDQDMESIKGDFSGLASLIQKTYGIAKDQASHQYDEFKKSVQSLLIPQAEEGRPKVSPVPTTTKTG